MNWRAARAARVALSVASPSSTLVRRAWLVVLHALSSPALVAVNLAVNGLVLYVLLRALYTLHKATLVIGGEALPCLVK